MTHVNSGFKRTAIALCLVLSSAHSAVAETANDGANDATNKNPSVIVGGATGAALGGLAAGPIGAVVGGIIGLMIGNDVEQQAELSDSQMQLARQTAALNTLQDELIAWQQHAMLQPVNEVTVVEPLLPELTTSIQFKTGQANIEAVYHEQLTLLAELMTDAPGLGMQIIGYADPRGSQDANFALSQARANSVKQQLVKLGVDPANIVTHARGEQPAEQNNSFESYFFDRKAVIMLAPQEKMLTAQH